LNILTSVDWLIDIIYKKELHRSLLTARQIRTGMTGVKTGSATLPQTKNTYWATRRVYCERLKKKNNHLFATGTCYEL
jgi:hypothetical protein